MQYTFIEKAQQEPDLQDVVNYLSQPLHIIEELYNKFPKLSLTSKVDDCNQDLYYKCEKILNYFLPNLINNYCHFSLKYRNEHIIKKENTKNGIVQYTAKDLLLNDISKVIEEIYIIEKQFNEHNKFEFLVTNRLVSDLGKKANILNHELEYDTESVNLKNEFDYNSFKKQDMNHVFVKTPPVPEIKKPEPYVASTKVETPVIQKTQPNGDTTGVGGFFIVTGTLLIGVMAAIIAFAPSKKNPETEVVQQPVTTKTVQYNTNPQNKYSYFIINEFPIIKQYINVSYAKDNKIIVNNEFISQFDHLTDYGKTALTENVVFNNTTIKNDNDGYTVTLNNVSQDACSTHLASHYNTYQEIKINNKVVNFSNVDPSAIKDFTHLRCELVSTKLELTALKKGSSLQ